MPKPRNPGYDPGNHWVTCDRCGFEYRNDVMKKTWDNLWVCPYDWEPRQPQDFVRARRDKITPAGALRPVPEFAFDPTAPHITLSALAGVAIAGCAIADFPENNIIPDGQFTNTL